MGILENVALVNGISLTISVLIPILVMVWTLRSENKRFKRQMEEAEKEFNKTLQTEMEHYLGNMQLQKENSRVSQLPFLFLDPNIKLDERRERIIFPLKICNKGNGTALDIKVVSRPDGAGKGNLRPGEHFLPSSLPKDESRHCDHGKRGLSRPDQGSVHSCGEGEAGGVRY